MKEEYIRCITGLAEMCDDIKMLDLAYQILKGAVYNDHR